MLLFGSELQDYSIWIFRYVITALIFHQKNNSSFPFIQFCPILGICSKFWSFLGIFFHNWFAIASFQRLRESDWPKVILMGSCPSRSRTSGLITWYLNHYTKLAVNGNNNGPQNTFSQLEHLKIYNLFSLIVQSLIWFVITTKIK